MPGRAWAYQVLAAILKGNAGDDTEAVGAARVALEELAATWRTIFPDTIGWEEGSPDPALSGRRVYAPDPITGVSNTNPVTPTTTAGQAGSAQSTDGANAANAADTPAAASGGADLADVGQTEQLLQSIIQAASTTPGIDQAKVADLQQAIASGAYQANPQSIAQKIVELEAQLGTAGPLQ